MSLAWAGFQDVTLLPGMPSALVYVNEDMDLPELIADARGANTRHVVVFGKDEHLFHHDSLPDLLLALSTEWFDARIGEWRRGMNVTVEVEGTTYWESVSRHADTVSVILLPSQNTEGARRYIEDAILQKKQIQVRYLCGEADGEAGVDLALDSACELFAYAHHRTPKSAHEWLHISVQPDAAVGAHHDTVVRLTVERWLASAVPSHDYPYVRVTPIEARGYREAL